MRRWTWALVSVLACGCSDGVYCGGPAPYLTCPDGAAAACVASSVEYDPHTCFAFQQCWVEPEPTCTMPDVEAELCPSDDFRLRNACVLADGEYRPVCPDGFETLCP